MRVEHSEQSARSEECGGAVEAVERESRNRNELAPEPGDDLSSYIIMYLLVFICRRTRKPCTAIRWKMFMYTKREL